LWFGLAVRIIIVRDCACRKRRRARGACGIMPLQQLAGARAGSSRSRDVDNKKTGDRV
jgi:hypothetical protein